MLPTRSLTPGSFTLLVPGDWSTPTGGYRYLRQMALALGEAGWDVNVLRIDADWPAPDAAALAFAAAQISALPDGTLVVADGLAYGVLASVVAPHAQRLRWVALVHHPLHLETGLNVTQQAQLLHSEAQALALARHIIVTSASTQRDVMAMGAATGSELGKALPRVAVVEPGVESRNAGSEEHEPHAFRLPPEAAYPQPGPSRPVQLLCVATVTPRKGHALLLQALAGLGGLNWTLHCVGSLTRDAATAAAARAQSQQPPLAGRVLWHGEVETAALQAHYAGADLLVLPSLHEGYGMAVAEALAAGLPVLASSAGALAQTLPPLAGLHVPPGDVPALQAALQRLINEPALRMQLAAGARSAAQTLPTWPQQAARFASVLQEVT